MDDTTPRQRDQRGRLLPGTPTALSRYAAGDRDEAARAAHTADKKARDAAAREAAGGGRPAGDGRRTVRVNVTLDGQSVQVRLTPAEAAALDRYARSRSGYVADLLRRGGITDTAGLDARRGDVTRSEYIRGVLVRDLDNEG